MKRLGATVVRATLTTFMSMGHAWAVPGEGGPAESIRRYIVVWANPSNDATGVMPIIPFVMSRFTLAVKSRSGRYRNSGIDWDVDFKLHLESRGPSAEP